MAWIDLVIVGCMCAALALLVASFKAPALRDRWAWMVGALAAGAMYWLGRANKPTEKPAQPTEPDDAPKPPTTDPERRSVDVERARDADTTEPTGGPTGRIDRWEDLSR